MRRLADRLAQITRRKSFRFGLIGVSVLVAVFVGMHPAQAASPGALNTMLSWLAALAMSVAEFLGMLVIATLDLTLPIMQYHGFTTSPVVTAGWSVVRDVVNMFFVVILIVIAMGTIFGSSRFAWKQQVPKLLIFAIVINFSKTLCGLMIDFAQVVMLTFANALKDIAGGNFIQLLGLGDIFSLSEKAAVIAGSADGAGQGVGAFDLFAASAAAVLMMMWVLAVVVALLFILVYRIVMLWILIVIAPLAWFVGGQNVFKSDAYAEWWKNFICYTSIGPIITFFLWLTLAVAGSGFIAANDSGFSSAAGSAIGTNVSGVVSRIFEFERLTSFVIGMAMLMAGFDAASKVCSGVKKAPGFDSIFNRAKFGGAMRTYGQIGKLGTKGIVTGAAVGAGAGKGASLAAVGVAGALVGGAGMAALDPRARGQAARAKGLKDMSKKRLLPTEIATAFARAGDVQQKELAEKIQKAASEGFKDMTSESKVDYLERIAETGRIPVGEEAKALGLMAEAMKDRKMREKLEAAGVLNRLYASGAGNVGMGDKLREYFRGTKGMEALDEFEAGRPDITGNFRNIDSVEELAKVDPTALAGLRGNAAFELQVSSFTTNARDASGRYMNGLEYLNAGLGNGRQARAWREGIRAVYEDMAKPTLDRVPLDELARNASVRLVGRREGLGAAMLVNPDTNVRRQIQNDPAMFRAVGAQALGLSFDAGGALTGIDRDELNRAVRENPLVLSNIPTSEIIGNPDLANAVAGSVLQVEAREIVKRYRRARSPGERRQLDTTVVTNALQSIEQTRGAITASFSGRPVPSSYVNTLNELRNTRNYLVSEIQSQEGGPSGILSSLASERGRINTELTSVLAAEAAAVAARNSALASEQRRLAINLRDDLRRLSELERIHRAGPI